MEWIDEPYWTIAQARDFLLQNKICMDEELAVDFIRRRVIDGKIALTGVRAQWRGDHQSSFGSRREAVPGIELIDLIFEALPDEEFVVAPPGASISTLDQLPKGIDVLLEGWGALRVRRADVHALCELP